MDDHHFTYCPHTIYREYRFSFETNQSTKREIIQLLEHQNRKNKNLTQLAGGFFHRGNLTVFPQTTYV